MTTTAFERVTTAFESAGLAVVYRSGNQASAQAPGHSPADRSVSITGTAGQVLMCCHAGEDKADVLAAVGLTLADLFDEPKRGTRDDYPDGRRVHRTPDKKFRQSGNTKGRSLFRTEFPAGATVYVCEGEKDVHAAEAVGLAATCSAMGAGKGHLFDWSPLAGRQVVIVADDDEPGRKHAAQVAGLLDGIAESTTVVKAAVGKDMADHIAAGHGPDELLPVESTKTSEGFVAEQAEVELAETGADGEPAVFIVRGYERQGVIRDGMFHYTLQNGEERTATMPGEGEPVERRSVAAQLVDLARAHYQLGITDADEAFGVTADRPHIALPLRGGKTGLRAELARRFFADTNTVASQQALADAGMVLEGYAAQEQPRRVFLRVGEHQGAVYIDTGDTEGTVIRIAGGQWETVPVAPVLFRRTRLTGELPVPIRGKGGPRLWEFIGIAPEDRPILLAVLVAALVQVDVPHVVLHLAAEQGSAKSTTTRNLVDLIDPSSVPLRQPPRDPATWVTAASASWVVGLDNLAGDIDGWFSESLCRASTGDGDVRRALYTDSDVSVTSFRRCVIGNGIDVTPVKGDLAERFVTVKLPRITHRRTESEYDAAWREARPEIFAALLDLAAKVHNLLPTIVVDDLPRMADFAKVLAAVDQVMKTKGLARYREQARTSARDSLDVPFIRELIAGNHSFTDVSSAELLDSLTPSSPDWRPMKGWPRNARAVTGLLTRHAPAMRAQGWQVDNDDGRNHLNRTLWTIGPRRPEKAGNRGSRSSRDSSAQVTGINGRESGENARATASQAITRGDSSNSRISHPGNDLTSGNGLASHASQKNGHSPVACPYCTEPLVYDDDRRDGFHTDRSPCVAAHRKGMGA